MSARIWKRQRRLPQRYAREIDREKRTGVQPPWWIRLAAAVFEGAIRERWYRRWECRHERALRTVVKRVSHERMHRKR